MNKIKFSKKSFVYVIIILLIFYILFFDSASFYKTHNIKNKLALLQHDIEDMKKENEQLKLENKKLENDKSVWEKKLENLECKKKVKKYLFSKKVTVFKTINFDFFKERI